MNLLAVPFTSIHRFEKIVGLVYLVSSYKFLKNISYADKQKDKRKSKIKERDFY